VTLPTGDIRAEDLILAAKRHGMIRWVADAARETRGAPADYVDDCKRAAHAHAVRALERLRELREILDCLELAAIPVVLFKGAAQAAWLYGDPCAREYADADLLIRNADWSRACEALAALGFAPAMSRSALRAIYGTMGAWPFYRANGCGVDLHWRLSAQRFPLPMTAEQVFAGSAAIDLSGRRVQTLNPTHAATLLLAHTAKHVWYALEQVLAIAHAAGRPDVDWAEVWKLTSRAGVVRGGAVGLRLACDLFECTPPATFASAIRVADGPLLDDAYAALALPANTFPDRWHVRRAQRASFDRVADRLEYDVRVVLEPTSREWRAASLSGPFTLFYVPLRVLRLGCEAIQRTAPSRRPS
jgi:hypothetical protein